MASAIVWRERDERFSTRTDRANYMKLGDYASAKRDLIIACDYKSIGAWTSCRLQKDEIGGGIDAVLHQTRTSWFFPTILSAQKKHK